MSNNDATTKVSHSDYLKYVSIKNDLDEQIKNITNSKTVDASMSTVPNRYILIRVNDGYADKNPFLNFNNYPEFISDVRTLTSNKKKMLNELFDQKRYYQNEINKYEKRNVQRGGANEDKDNNNEDVVALSTLKTNIATAIKKLDIGNYDIKDGQLYNKDGSLVKNIPYKKYDITTVKEIIRLITLVIKDMVLVTPLGDPTMKMSFESIQNLLNGVVENYDKKFEKNDLISFLSLLGSAVEQSRDMFIFINKSEPRPSLVYMSVILGELLKYILQFKYMKDTDRRVEGKYFFNFIGEIENDEKLIDELLSRLFEDKTYIRQNRVKPNGIIDYKKLAVESRMIDDNFKFSGIRSNEEDGLFRGVSQAFPISTREEIKRFDPLTNVRVVIIKVRLFLSSGEEVKRGEKLLNCSYHKYMYSMLKDMNKSPEEKALEVKRREQLQKRIELEKRKERVSSLVSNQFGTTMKRKKKGGRRTRKRR